MRRKRQSLQIAGIALAAGCALAAPSLADCGSASVKITGTDLQREAACNALREVTEYFARIGLAVEPAFTLEFRDQVFIDVWDFDNPAKRGKMQVSGVFDASRRSITITSSTSPFREGRKPWKLPWGPEIASSILRHELTHMVLSHVLESRKSRPSRSWLEFIAYSVQFELMPAELRERVLALNAEVQPFPYPEMVNAMIYGIDPDQFGISSYLFAKANGGRAFIRRIIDGEVNFTTGEFLWTK